METKEETNENEKKLYMDGTLRKNLQSVRKLVMKKDWDFVFLVDGMEGAGKSVFTQQIAFECDPTLTIDRICFEADDFKKQIINAKPNQAIIFDEAYRGMSSRRAMSNINYTINAMMMEIRQKNLFIFIVLPSFFHLDSIISLHRSRALFHIYVKFNKNWERGYFAAFNYDRKNKLYLNGKRYHTYGCVSANFKGRFTKKSPIDWETYKKKKAKVLERLADDEENQRTSPTQKRITEQRGVLLYLLNDVYGYSYKEICDKLNEVSGWDIHPIALKGWKFAYKIGRSKL